MQKIYAIKNNYILYPNNCNPGRILQCCPFCALFRPYWIHFLKISFSGLLWEKKYIKLCLDLWPLQSNKIHILSLCVIIHWEIKEKIFSVQRLSVQNQLYHSARIIALTEQLLWHSAVNQKPINQWRHTPEKIKTPMITVKKSWKHNCKREGWQYERTGITNERAWSVTAKWGSADKKSGGITTKPIVRAKVWSVRIQQREL